MVILEMELFRAGEAIVRHSQPLLPFLAPGIYRSSPNHCSRTISRVGRLGRTPSAQKSRCLSSSTYLRQNGMEAKTSSGVDASPQPGPSSRVTDELNNVLNSTRGLKSQSLRTPQTTSTNPSAAVNGEKTGQSNFGELGKGDRSQNQLIDMGDDFWDLFGAPKGKTGLAPPTAVPEKKLPFKLNPSVGRTVRIDANRGMDVGRAFRQLDIMCARNRVKRDAARQRFHERPGLKRKRLKSERWRKRFKEGFKALVQKAMAMKKQGW